MTTVNLAVCFLPPSDHNHFLSRILLTAVVRQSRLPSLPRPIFFFAIFGSFLCSLPPCHLLAKNVWWKFSSRILRKLRLRFFEFSVFWCLFLRLSHTLIVSSSSLPSLPFNSRLNGVNYYGAMGLNS